MTDISQNVNIFTSESSIHEKIEKPQYIMIIIKENKLIEIKLDGKVYEREDFKSENDFE